MAKEEMEVIEKKDLIGGKYYLGKTEQRGMPVGVWDSKEGCFICLKPDFGGWAPYKMNHIEDEPSPERWVAFEPIKMIT